MFRSLKKAASSIERSFESAFSSAPTSHTAFTNTVITIDSITVRLGRVIAEGGFSFIHVATAEHQNSIAATRYAVKRLSCHDAHAQSQAEHEVAFLTALAPHPNIVRFHGAAFQNAHAFLLFDLIDGGTLPDRLERLSAQGLTDATRLAIFADVLCAVAHLHSCDPPVAWRDAKLENVIYDRLTDSYKICDFGSVSTTIIRPKGRASVLAADDDVAENCTLMYRAPELVDLYSGHLICEKVDVWALGCIWHALLFDTLPFDGSSALAICNGLSQIPERPRYPVAFAQLLRACLVVDPADRPDAFAVLAAVRRLQDGQALDDHLLHAVRRVRHLRNADFGRPPVTVDIALTIEIGVKDVDQGLDQGAGEVAGQGGVDGDWADFASAFDHAKAVASNGQAVKLVGDSLIDLSENSGSISKAAPSATSKRGGDAHRNIAKDDTADLIDFFSSG